MGVARVRETGIIHRHIKPQNILVAFDVGAGVVRVVLADFGLGRLEKCVCSWHCYVPGHRYKGGCDSVILLSGWKYCRSC
eukprot:348300-Lingulodinium_polyedra.AAC.1